MSEQTATALLIDLSSLVYPLWHISSREPDPNWTSTRAIARVRSLAAAHQHVAGCADSGRSFRRDLAPSYKANRPDKEEPLIHQLGLAVSRMMEDGYPVWAAPGFEADDLIATACREAEARGLAVLIASSDKDLMQLVGGGVRVLSLSSERIYDAEAVFEKFGVRPDQMRDYLTLVGDASDNIKGVPGVGPKRAADLLKKFGTLDAVLEAQDAGLALGVSPSIAQALKDSRTLITEARQLITLRTDAPIDFDLILAERKPVQTEDSMSEIGELDAEPVTPEADAVAAQEAKAEVETAIVKADPEPEVFTGEWSRQLEPRTTKDAAQVAKWLHTSRLFSQYGCPEAVFSVALAGRELGLGVMSSLRGFHVVEGKPTMAADLIRSLVLSSGKAEYFVCTRRDREGATWRTHRKGDPAPTELTFTWEDADAAQVPLKGRNGGDTAWVKHRADMLAKTASTKLCRLVYPDVTFGLYATEEIDSEL